MLREDLAGTDSSTQSSWKKERGALNQSLTVAEESLTL